MEQLPTDIEYQEMLRKRTGIARPTAQDYLMDFMSVAPMVMGLPMMSGGGRIPMKRTSSGKHIPLPTERRLHKAEGKLADALVKEARGARRHEIFNKIHKSMAGIRDKMDEIHGWEPSLSPSSQSQDVARFTRKRLASPKVGVGEPIITGESLAKEHGLRYIGGAEGLEYYGMKVPKQGGGVGETSIATKGISREQLLKKIRHTEEVFGKVK